jgi:hypothetical protein
MYEKMLEVEEKIKKNAFWIDQKALFIDEWIFLFFINRVDRIYGFFIQN